MNRRGSFLLSLLTALLVASACGGSGTLGLKSELVTQARFPAAIAFAPDGRLFFNERGAGRVRILTPAGEHLQEPFVQLNVAGGLEWGLIGVAFDPDYESNNYVYVYYMAPVAREMKEGDRPVAKPMLVRYTDVDNRGEDRTVLIGDLPETSPEFVSIHVGGNLHFGPDGYLYVSVGDHVVAENANDLSILPGKILRINKEDGSAALDNPFVDDPEADPRIFAYGFRNPWDFDFHPRTGELYAADNGVSACDELNRVAAGQYYGHPESFEFANVDCFKGPGVHPIHALARPGTEPTDAPSNVGPAGLQFVSGVAADRYPTLADSLLLCEWHTLFMRRLILDGENQDKVLSDDIVIKDCSIDIAVSPDGIIYYGNRNEIRRLVPE